MRITIHAIVEDAEALVQMADTDRIRWRVERSVGMEMSKLTNVDELFGGRHFDREVILGFKESSQRRLIER